MMVYHWVDRKEYMMVGYLAFLTAVQKATMKAAPKDVH